MSASDLDPPPGGLTEQQAAAWFARRRSSKMTADETTQFEAWLEADPGHRDAYEALGRTWVRMEITRDAPEIVALRAQARQASLILRRNLVGRIAAGLALAVVLGGSGLWLAQADVLGLRKYPNQTFRTEVGQRSTVTLPDGSVVTLNTGTVLRTVSSADRRVLYLDKGQAYFRVAKDRAHPFVVHAAGRTVTAVGTAFDVRAEPGRFEVTLVEGKVKVETPRPRLPDDPARAGPPAAASQTTELTPGTQFVVVDESRWAVTSADTATQTAWVSGWLKFRNKPLGEVVAEFSRYSNRRIVIDDPALAARPITGRFEAGDISAFVTALEGYNIVRVQAQEAGPIHLASPQ